ncbi:hypothetical protein SIN8267_01065 [Sinobacterium norvegicum]|uniref:DUF3313 domain-containing protein n=1 Tax=Sinobacterium norvegicum TaxID=1641715 RepID=A0ABM9AD81_9GAMM|nr:DUF3313 family protein [Sinobacterium norvegicum]CAH0990964.1 hypothetical protein SIN8267_01065 [Sinobacterium norvegicum]
MKRRILTPLSATLFSLFISTSLIAASPAQNTDSTIKIEAEYMSEQQSLADYRQFYIQPFDLTDTKIIPAPWLDQKNFRWDIPKKNIKQLQTMFKQSIKAGIEANSDYAVVDDEQAGVLVINVSIISFTPYADRKDTELLTKGSGEIRLLLQLRDGATGKLIYLLEGTEETGEDYQPNTDVARLQDADKLFHIWGKHLRQLLDSAQQ